MFTCERPAYKGMYGAASVSCWSYTEQRKLTGDVVEDLTGILVLNVPCAGMTHHQ